MDRDWGRGCNYYRYYCCIIAIPHQLHWATLSYTTLSYTELHTMMPKCKCKVCIICSERTWLLLAAVHWSLICVEDVGAKQRYLKQNTKIFLIEVAGVVTLQVARQLERAAAARRNIIVLPSSWNTGRGHGWALRLLIRATVFFGDFGYAQNLKMSL